MGKRSKKQTFMLFSAESEKTCRVISRVSFEQGIEKEALGVWERVYDQYCGELIGFRLRVRVEDDSSIPSRQTPSAIPAREMEVFAFAGTRFLDANSRTARLQEVDRLSREKSGRDPEDMIERTVRKVLVWPHVGAAKGDILRAWPRGAA